MQLTYSEVRAADEQAQHRRQQAQVGTLVARAQIQAELERDMTGEMTNHVEEQMQLNSYVMIAPEIVVSTIGIVAYEPCEDHNKVQIHNFWALKRPQGCGA